MSEAAKPELALVPSATTHTPTPEPQSKRIAAPDLGFGRARELKRSWDSIKPCMSAYRRAYKACIENGSESETFETLDAKQEASEAYCEAMPLLSTRENVADFIACAAHGILIDAIPEKKIAPILYAAQLALAALHPEQRRR